MAAGDQQHFRRIKAWLQAQLNGSTPKRVLASHYSAIATSGYRSLDENQKVEFDVTQGPKGPQAENIRPL